MILDRYGARFRQGFRQVWGKAQTRVQAGLGQGSDKGSGRFGARFRQVFRQVWGKGLEMGLGRFGTDDVIFENAGNLNVATLLHCIVYCVAPTNQQYLTSRRNFCFLSVLSRILTTNVLTS